MQSRTNTVIITKNLEEFRNGTFVCDSLDWCTSTLDLDILSNFRQVKKMFFEISSYVPMTNIDSQVFEHVEDLYLSNCNLSSLKDLPLMPNLINLECPGNSLTSLSGVERFPKLEKLNCAMNQITSISESDLQSIRNLKDLDLSENALNYFDIPINFPYLTDLVLYQCELTSITGLRNAPMLKFITCGDNLIEKITLESSNDTKSFSVNPHLGLKHLNCRGNRISRIDQLPLCPNLKILQCSDNLLEDVSGLIKYPNLRELYLDGNHITDIKVVSHLHRLYHLQCERNPCFNTKFLDNFKNILKLRFKIFNSSIYNDDENVYQNRIKKSIIISILNIISDDLGDWEFDIEMLNKEPLSPETIELISDYYDCNTDNKIFNINFRDFFPYVWRRIDLSENREHLIYIFNQELRDRSCSTGVIARCVSILAGIFDDVSIEISEPDRINGIIYRTHKKINPYDPIEHRQLVRSKLMELNYSEETITPWLNAIYDPSLF